jgi:hypothetical protein
MPDIPVFPPTKENELLAFSSNFANLITATPTTFGLVAAQATAYAALHLAFSDAYATIITPAGNSKSNIAIKNQAKEALLYAPGGAWQLVNIIQAFPGTTNAMRTDLGLRIPDTEMTPVPPPEVQPLLYIVSQLGRVIKLKLRDRSNEESRSKPPGVSGATVLYYVGDDEPTSTSNYIFSSNTSRTVFDVEIPQTVAAGSRVWFTAFWFNAKMESGPIATPVTVRVDDNLALAA